MMNLDSSTEEMSAGETSVLVTLHGVGEREHVWWDMQRVRVCVCTQNGYDTTVMQSINGYVCISTWLNTYVS